ncbi:ATP-binding SpoIIE family protein phosphatase [Streptomyces muensis]|uniref:protein-serine/threonine phosphatase n=1 Tax=Streptomyces muensis TaxID=1077944 RepID=A0A9X1PY84_STRM4|nr:SpoIIE family protein phosphatase [Streptomyces muensis]MCF1595208.1 SpoIIE family protein phosphatase [Streptomyces muensis]
MNTSRTPISGSAFSLGGIATALIDREGTVLRWSGQAAELVGRAAAEVCGRPIGQLFADAPGQDVGATHCGSGIPTQGQTALRHKSGAAVEVTFHSMPLDDSSDVLLLAAPSRQVADWERGTALLQALLTQDRVGVSIHDSSLTVVQTNAAATMLDGHAPAVEGCLREILNAEDVEDTEAALLQVLNTGVPLIGREQRVRQSDEHARQTALSLSAFRLEDAEGRPAGICTLFTDATASRRARLRLDLRREAANRIGASLNVMRTAQALADVLVPALGDLAYVDLAEAVREGDEPPKVYSGGRLYLRRAAVASASGTWPAPLLQPGDVLPQVPDTPDLRFFLRGGTALVTDRAGIINSFMRRPETSELIPMTVPERAHSLVASPLLARGLLLGQVAVWRTEQSDPFEKEDEDLLAEIASRSAVSVDNARRYTREHRSTVALQRRLLPRATPDPSAVESARFYRPAADGAEISGDWYDVIPLPSLRVALVVGDVIGHGLAATATMGRLRTAVHTLADLELDPTELLTHLDGLVQQLAEEAAPEHRDAVGATCLYAVYDPVDRQCSMASAGHLPPLLVRPDGSCEVLEVSPGPPLGVGGMPFETTSIELAPGSVLALYTDGLIARSDHDLDAGTRRLTSSLAALCRPDCPLDGIGRTLMADISEAAPRDDATLLLARTRAVPPHNTASWEFPADPAVVTEARKATSQQLTHWGLDELIFTTELIVSELVTNAIRYAGGPVGLRLIRENALVCEVTDPSNTQPRLRRARTTDEGGRGMFLVAQLTTRWGSRYGQQGKTIWAEQSIAPATPRTASQT